MSSHEINLAQDVAHDLVGFVLLTQLIDLRHDLCERPFDIADGSLRVELALRIETALATNEFFSVETGKGMQDLIAGWRRICQEAGQAGPQRWHLPRF